MRFIQFIKKVLTPQQRGTHVRARSPSTEYPAPIDAIIAILESEIMDGQWASFEASDRDDFIVQVAGDQINTCKEQVDIAALARTIGLESLAETIKTHGDGTMHEVPNASPKELAELVNAIFVGHYELRPDYQLDACIDG